MRHFVRLAVVLALAACQPGPPAAAPSPTVAPLRSLAVVVSAPAGAPVGGATVCAVTVADRQEGCGEARASGTARLEGHPGTYALHVTPKQATRSGARGRISSDEADVVEVRSADVGGVDVALIRGNLLTGIVRGPSGPIEDAQVCLRTLAAPLGWECERTKKNGSYLALREPGQYYL